MKLGLILWFSHSFAFALGWAIHALLHEHEASVKDERPIERS